MVNNLKKCYKAVSDIYFLVYLILIIKLLFYTIFLLELCIKFKLKFEQLVNICLWFMLRAQFQQTT